MTLTSPNVLASNTIINNNVSCSGNCDGSATTTPTGGTAPYTFSWSGGQTTGTVTGLCAGTFSVTVTDVNGCSDIDVITITQPSILTSNISSTTSSCALCNGIATVTTSGGTFPYTFLWSPVGQTTSSATGLCAGNYTVLVTDAQGCTNSGPAVISPVLTLTITLSGSSVSCPGSCDGIANATPFGGGSPYTYSWTTAPVQTAQTATGLCAGNYTVTIGDTNGCISTSTLTLTNPAPLTITMSSVSASCGQWNGTATAAISGGTGSYTYTWSGFPVQTTATATGLQSGNYSVTVADANNCVSTKTVTVGNIPVISNNASTTLSACGGNTGAICLAPSGGTPGYTYLWAPGGSTTACVTGLAAGIYTVMITDAAGCVGTFQNVVGNVGAPTITVNTQVNPTCNASCNGSISITASGGVPSYDYLWSPGNQTTTSISALCAGTYIIQTTDDQPCTVFATVILTDPAQINTNPTITNVSCSGGNNGNICLSPTGGTSPYTYKWLPGGQTTSCFSSLTAGTYSVVVTDAFGCDDTVAIPVSAPATLSVTIASTNITCNSSNNGTATATVTGGTTLYTYAWSNGSILPSIVGLSPGNYSLTVTDSKGCIGTASVTITQPTVLTTSTSATNITCNGLCDGTALLTPSGGTPAYTYSWLPGGETTANVTGLCIGNYIGTLTDLNGCASTKTVTITQPSAISPTVTSTNASCFGGCDGTASVSVSGGTGAYTYLWFPGGYTTAAVTGLCVGSYSLTVSDGNGCGNTPLVSITAPLVIQANITSTSPTCTNSCDGSASSSPVGGTGSYTYSWSTVPVQTTATATGLCAGNYTLTLTDGNGCFVTQVTNIAAPVPITQANGIAGATCLLCNGSITIIASGGTVPYSYFWNTGATTATITGLCAGVYVDTVMDANGCLSVDTMGLSNTTGPTTTVAGTNITCYGACDGVATVLNAFGDGPPWIYSWFPYNQTTQTITGLCPLQYFSTVTDTNGCKTVDPINITQPAQLAPNPVITNATCFGICNGGIATSATGGTGAYTYLWSTGATTASITGQCAGSYTLTLLDANNCVFTSTITIGQNTVITSTVTSTNDSCNLSCDGTASVLISGGTIPYTYLWSPTALTTSAATGLCAGTYTINTTDAVGCQNVSTAVIAQPSALGPGLTASNPTCNGLCNGTLSSGPLGGTPPYTYLWSPGNATTTSITGLCAGNYTLTLSDANNCSSTTTVTLTNPAVLTCTATTTSADCNNLCNGGIDITPSGGTGVYTFIWSPGGQTTEDISGLCPGIDSVIITDVNGCSLTYSVAVGVVTNVAAIGGNDTSYCVGGTATLCSNSFNATSIAWYNITTGWTSLGSTTCISQSPPVGVTNFALIALNGICSDTDTVSVTVNTYPVLVPANDTSFCLGDSVTLCVNGATVYQWYTLPAWTPFATGSCITVSPAAGTTSYGIIGFNGVCSDSDSVTVNVLLLPVAIAGNDTSNCFGDSITLCSFSLNTTSVAWYSVPAWTLIDTTACVTFVPPAGTNDFALIASNGACSDTDTVAIFIFPAIIVDAGANVTMLASATTQLNGTGNGTYVWSPPTGLSSTTIANPTVNLTVTTTYTLTVTDTSGCVGWDTVRITIIHLVIPNDGLSPNGDGINDIWEIPNIESFPGALVEIYNRWGERLFSTTDYKNNKWNAKYNGKDLPVGTYYYIINLNSDKYKDPITGPITILR
jgi:gliding motility-associated-like protein